MSRRQFLGGMTAAAGGFALMPSIALLAAQKAAAADNTCSLPNASERVPVFLIELPGGGNIAGANVIVGGRASDGYVGQDQLLPLDAYKNLALRENGVSLTASIDSAGGFKWFSGDDVVRPGENKFPNAAETQRDFGLSFHANSGLLKGLRDGTSEETRKKVDGVVFCTSTLDDTHLNPFNSAFWLAKSGLQGQLTASLTNDSRSIVGRSLAPDASYDARFRPLLVRARNFNTTIPSLGALSGFLKEPVSRDRFFSFVGRLSSSSLNRFLSSGLDTQLAAVLGCHPANISKLQSFGSDTFDLRKDAAMSSLSSEASKRNRGFGNEIALREDYFSRGTMEAAFSDIALQAAQMSKLLADGFAGVASLSMIGNFDYHGQSIAAARALDVAAGRVIGKILETFAQKQKPVMIHIFTDGGVSSSNSDSWNSNPTWDGDNGEVSANLLFVYNPAAALSGEGRTRSILQPEFLPKDESSSGLYGRQVGHFYSADNRSLI
ncbi:MAG: hypothetical protein KGQ59_11545, partial [Bdellovibrionales bacterium]|nr:hypothetical protein [Bdellovibrionales bacterium]